MFAYNFVGITCSRKDTGRSTSKWTDRDMNSWLIDLLKDDHFIIAFKFSLQGFDSFTYISSKRWIISNKAWKKYKSRTTSLTINNNWWCFGVIKTNQRLWLDYVFGLCPHPFPALMIRCIKWFVNNKIIIIAWPTQTKYHQKFLFFYFLTVTFIPVRMFLISIFPENHDQTFHGVLWVDWLCLRKAWLNL